MDGSLFNFRGQENGQLLPFEKQTDDIERYSCIFVDGIRQFQLRQWIVTLFNVLQALIMTKIHPMIHSLKRFFKQKFLYKYIFHYKYVASAVIYFKCGQRIPKSVRNGKKRDHDAHAAKRTYVLLLIFKLKQQHIRLRK